ncbi:hypothetical protein EDB80DRAFT_680558 [Ilyonectria destructans]|nr:hypothetical protein EDB80DRAFT_680558 [Ilyonectria destructans]
MLLASRLASLQTAPFLLLFVLPLAEPLSALSTSPGATLPAAGGVPWAVCCGRGPCLYRGRPAVGNGIVFMMIQLGRARSSCERLLSCLGTRLGWSKLHPSARLFSSLQTFAHYPATSGFHRPELVPASQHLKEEAPK